MHPPSVYESDDARGTGSTTPHPALRAPMPRAIPYVRLGHRVADELVDWFNKADATYRTDLREINELNFTRFDAKVEQRFAEVEARWGLGPPVSRLRALLGPEADPG